jgi:hypothetical protein
MLAVRHWQNDGFLLTKFLWVPQGYSNVAKLFDDEAVNHHAHGISREREGKPGYKRIYTHFPSWYAVPYGVLGKLGIFNKSVYQYYAIVLSVIGLVFFYLFLELEYSSLIALIAIGFYSFSRGFLDYADSIATMPYDDFFRFAFLYFYSKHFIKRDPKTPWGCYLLFFLSCMTSIDSLLFILFWAYFYPVHIKKIKQYKTLLPFLVIPAIAILIQLTQNSLYMGIKDALSDWAGQFHSLSDPSAKGLPYTWGLIKDLLHKNAGTTGPLYILFIYLFSNYFAKKKFSKTYAMSGGLFIAGVLMVVVFPKKIQHLPYENRQLLPFISLLFALLCFCLIQPFKKGKLLLIKNLVTLLLLVPLLSFVIKKIDRQIDFPPQPRLDKKIENFFVSLDKKYPEDKVLFCLGKATLPSLPSWENPIAVQAHPLIEYFADSTVLVFYKLEDILKDLHYLWNKKEATFTPLLVFNKADEKNVLAFLKLKNIKFNETQIEGSFGERALKLDSF